MLARLTHRRADLAWAIVLAVGLLVRLPWLHVGGHVADLGWFTKWSDELLRLPLDAFYDLPGQDSEYLPGLLLLLAAVARGAAALGQPPTGPAYYPVLKLLALAGDFLLAALVAALARRILGRPRGRLAAAAILLNPALVFGGVFWGQLDALGAVPPLAALLALVSRRPYLAALATGVALVVKPQEAPFLVIAWLVSIRQAWLAAPARGGRAALDFGWGPANAGLATAAGLCLPFGLGLVPIPGVRWSLLDRLALASTTWPVTSANALNLWSLGGMWQADTVPGWLGLSARAWGFGLFAAIALLALAVAWRRPADPRTLLWSCALVAIAFFAVNTRMHERYLLVALPLLAALAPGSWRLAALYVAVSAWQLTSLVYGYFGAPHTADAAAAGWALVATLGALGGLALTAGGVLGAAGQLRRPTAAPTAPDPGDA